jgi:2-succinyl-6-hydroxy-2,4-cyclohexadiene-1-carboxylate synthase
LSSDFEITALHGFAGTPQDWDFFPEIKNKINLWSWPLLALTSLDAGADYLAQSAPRSTSKPQILVGYSMGGRLALHALIAHPTVWAGAILISSHLGLKTDSEREARLSQDEMWAQKWQTDPWDQLWSEWNSQAVFENSNLLCRSERDFDRLKLAQVLRGWSLGEQKDLREKYLKIQVPTLFVVGERDLKFLKLQKEFQAEAEALQALHLGFKTVAGAGHRVPWDQPTLFSQSLSQFVDSIAIIG